MELANLSVDDSLPSPSLGVVSVICPRQSHEDQKWGSHTEDAGDDMVCSPSSAPRNASVGQLLEQTSTTAQS